MQKTDAVEVFRVLNLVSGGPLAGMMLWEAVIILPVVRSLPASEGFPALRLAGARAWRVAPVLGTVASVSALAIIGLWPWKHVDASAVFTLIGIGSLTTAVLITFGPYAGADKDVRARGWRDTPDGEPGPLRRLARLHALRTTFYALAAAAFAVAAVA